MKVPCRLLWASRLLPARTLGRRCLHAFVHIISQLLQPTKRQGKSDLLIPFSITKPYTGCFQLLLD